jgi:hypothetical protein
MKDRPLPRAGGGRNNDRLAGRIRPLVAGFPSAPFWKLAKASDQQELQVVLAATTRHQLYRKLVYNEIPPVNHWEIFYHYISIG